MMSHMKQAIYIIVRALYFLLSAPALKLLSIRCCLQTQNVLAFRTAYCPVSEYFGTWEAVAAVKEERAIEFVSNNTKSTCYLESIGENTQHWVWSITNSVITSNLYFCATRDSLAEANCEPIAVVQAVRLSKKNA